MRVDAPQGTLTETLRFQIVQHKAELLTLLCDQSYSTPSVLPPIRRRSTNDAAPLSFAQERLWFLEQLESGSSVYNICRASRLSGELNIAALEASLGDIVRRHEVLRSQIHLVDRRPTQIALPVFDIKVPVTELGSLTGTERGDEELRRIKAEAEHPFDLSTGPFLRARLLQTGDEEHTLILTTHHIVADAWSMGILTRELWTLYEARVAGRISPLKDLSIQYADFAVWQKDWLQGEVLESQLAYWKKQLDDIQVLNLPTDRPRPPRQSFHGAMHPITLPQSLTASINELSHGQGVTLFMTLLAAFQVLLYRYSGQEDVVVGSPIANRGRTELEPLIGFFVNTLVLRADLSGSPSFKEILLRVRDVCLDAYAHRDLPFEKLVQLQPERDLSRNPLFQVMFVLQNATRPLSQISSIRSEPVEIESGRSQFDLSLFLRERDGKLIGYLEYSTDLFNRDTIERMADHFQTLLKSIVAHPDQSIATLPLLTEAGRHQILVEWNDTGADYPEESCIHELFEAQVERTPYAIALEFEEEKITYREINRRANQLAHHLISFGVGPEKLVGICFERSVEMMVGLLGILKAGGAYVPLDPNYPKERLQFMVEDSRVPVILTQDSLARGHQLLGISSVANGSGPKIICLDSDWDTIAQQNGGNLNNLSGSTNLAYVIYTSGSTGKPKGVGIEHRSVVNCLHSIRRLVEVTKNDALLAVTTISFDIAGLELYLPWMVGAKVVLASREETLDARLLLKRLRDSSATMMQATPASWKLLLEAEWQGRSDLKVLCGGEPLSPQLADQLMVRGSAVWNLYGPTETTIWSAAYQISPNESQMPIGRPLSNTEIYILDAHEQLVPIGIPGEIHIGGAGVARGYLNQSELTAEKFIPNPFSSEPGARLYRTGDLARYRADGNIEFLGRIDNQVKIRGHRVELGEIEHILNQHPAVKESVVIPSSYARLQWVRTEVGVTPSTNSMREEAPACVRSPVEGAGVSDSDRNLIAYLVSNAEKPLATELGSFLRQKLPEYMIPSSFVVLDALPLTPNGKIDRSKLPPPDGARPEIDRDFVEPRSEIEELVAQIWREVLNLDRIGIHDNFFEMGGHSLLATQVIARLSDAFSREIPLKTLFDAPTITSFLGSLESIARDGNTPKLPPIVPVSRDRPLPLSMNQEHLWRLDQMIPGTHFFNMPFVYQLSGCLNIKALEKAIAEIIRRQEALRTVFIDVDGRPAQIIEPASDFQLPVIDLRSLATDSLAEQAASLILKEREQPFDLARGPLLRTKLLRMTDEDDLFLVTMHHIIGDHWSMLVFRRELAVLYQAFSQGRGTLLTELPIQFADFACWEQQAIEQESMKLQLVYWKKQLAAPAPELKFRKDGERKKRLSFQIYRQPIEFDENLFASVKALARKENCTPFLIALTALNALLYLYTGATDIPIGTLVANRRRRETEGLIGHFVNTVVLRTRFSAEMTFNQLLKQVREVALSAYARQELPFEHLARVLDRKQNMKSDSLFQILFIYQNWSFQSQDTPGLNLASVDMRPAEAEQELMPTTFDLIFNLRETSTVLTGTVNYKVESIDEDIVRRMCESFGEVLRRMIAHMGQRFTNLSADAEV